MATARQIALASNYVAHSSTSKGPPMFLQKLYKIVSDPSTNDVICWSDAGDSFFINDHERLAKHLGNWFKHNKFASFVRQLNMYGFHKIPHLQQGVLRSDSDAEHSQFAHPDFHRGQEDRLIFIERKKQPGGNRDGNNLDLSLGVSSSVPPQSSIPSQELDWHSIVTGITAIRRHQTNISNELNELKRSNQVLWQEAMETRQRHQRQQDTINRIIKFLAGVFGQQVSTSPREKDDDRSSPHPVVPGTRLMIEGRKQGPGGGKVEITEVQDEENMSPVQSRGPSPQPYMVETPATTISRPLSRANSDVSTPLPRDVPVPSFPTSFLDIQNSFLQAAASTGSTTSHKTSKNDNSIISTQPRYPASDITHESINGQPRPSSHSPSFDVKFQNALNQLSVSDLQQLFASLAAQTNLPSDGPQQPQGQLQSLTSQLAPYKTPFDFGPFSPPSAKASDPENDSLIPNAPYRIDQNWQGTEDIEKDVNSVNSGIDTLIETLGLDHTLLDTVQPENSSFPSIDSSSILNSTGLPTDNSIDLNSAGQPSCSEDFFNTYLHNLNDSDMDPSLDFSVPTPADIPAASPADISLLSSSPETSKVDQPVAGVATKGRKRKSDGPPNVAVKLYSPPNPRAKKQKK